MKIGLIILALFGVITIQDTDRPAIPKLSKENSTVRLSDLGWLQGAWSGKVQKRRVELIYSSSAGGMIVGATKEFTARSGRPMFDFEHIVDDKGTLVLTPYPFGKKSVSFRSTRVDAKARTVVFENMKHDFPQRFTYRASKPDELTIELEGIERGKTQVIRYQLSRTRR